MMNDLQFLWINILDHAVILLPASSQDTQRQADKRKTWRASYPCLNRGTAKRPAKNTNTRHTTCDYTRSASYIPGFLLENFGGFRLKPNTQDCVRCCRLGCPPRNSFLLSLHHFYTFYMFYTVKSFRVFSVFRGYSPPEPPSRTLAHLRVRLRRISLRSKASSAHFTISAATGLYFVQSIVRFHPFMCKDYTKISPSPPHLTASVPDAGCDSGVLK